jgi:hypothetical protein
MLTFLCDTCEPSLMSPLSAHLLRATLIPASFALTALAALPAHAAVDTMSKIRETRMIVLGVREAAAPFSFVNAQKQSVGYSVDLCMNAVEEIKRELKLPDIKVQYKPVSGPDRIPKLLSGEIDLECGSTTNTMARQEKVDFSYTFFVAGMRVLTSQNLHVDTVKDRYAQPEQACAVGRAVRRDGAQGRHRIAGRCRPQPRAAVFEWRDQQALRQVVQHQHAHHQDGTPHTRQLCPAEQAARRRHGARPFDLSGSEWAAAR